MLTTGNALSLALPKIIEQRIGKSTLGFGAEVKSREEYNVSDLLKQVIPQDLVKFGLIPELVGRVPMITTLQGLDVDSLVRILKEPKNSLIKQYLPNVSEVFFHFSFFSFLVVSLVEREAKRKRKKDQAPFL